MPVWAALAVVAIAVGATVWAGMTHSEQVLPRRDSGSYFQSSVELAEGHTRPVAIAPDTVGGPEVLAIDGITLASPAFYEIGTDQSPSIQPQFPIGPSAWYSVAWWLGGAGATLWAPAVLGGLGVLAFGLLAGWTVGARWAPLAALALALCFPLLHVTRSTYSEPLALLVLFASLAALVQSARAARALDVVGAQSAAAVSGGLLGAGVLVRVDTLREVILLMPVAAIVAMQQQRYARTLLIAAGSSTVLAFGLTWLTSSEYLRSIGGSLLPLVALGVAVALGCTALLWLGRRHALPHVIQALAAGSGRGRGGRRRGCPGVAAAVADGAAVGRRPGSPGGGRPAAAAGPARRRRAHLRGAEPGLDVVVAGGGCPGAGPGRGGGADPSGAGGLDRGA